MNKCVMCVLFPVFLSGLFGYMTGTVAEGFGWNHDIAGAAAGFVGFCAAQAFNYVCILITTRYHRELRRRSAQKKKDAS